MQHLSDAPRLAMRTDHYNSFHSKTAHSVRTNKNKSVLRSRTKHPDLPFQFSAQQKKKFASLQSTNSLHDNSRGGIAKMSNCMLLSHAKCFRVGLNEVRQLLTAQSYELLQEQCITH